MQQSLGRVRPKRNAAAIPMVTTHECMNERCAYHAHQCRSPSSHGLVRGPLRGVNSHAVVDGRAAHGAVFEGVAAPRTTAQVRAREEEQFSRPIDADCAPLPVQVALQVLPLAALTHVELVLLPRRVRHQGSGGHREHCRDLEGRRLGRSLHRKRGCKKNLVWREWRIDRGGRHAQKTRASAMLMEKRERHCGLHCDQDGGRP